MRQAHKLRVNEIFASSNKSRCYLNTLKFAVSLVHIKLGSNGSRRIFPRCKYHNETELVFRLPEALTGIPYQQQSLFLCWLPVLHTKHRRLSAFPLWICSRSVEVASGDNNHFLRTQSAFLRPCLVPVNNIPALRNKSHRKNHYLAV